MFLKWWISQKQIKSSICNGKSFCVWYFGTNLSNLLVKLLTFNYLVSLFMAIVKILCGIDKMENIMLHFSSQNGVKHVIVIRPMVSTGVNSPPPPKNWSPPLCLALPHMMTLKPPLPPNLFALPSPM